MMTIPIINITQISCLKKSTKITHPIKKETEYKIRNNAKRTL